MICKKTQLLVNPSADIAAVGKWKKYRTRPDILSSLKAMTATRCDLSEAKPLEPQTNSKRSMQSVAWSIGRTVMFSCCNINKQSNNINRIQSSTSKDNIKSWTTQQQLMNIMNTKQQESTRMWQTMANNNVDEWCQRSINNSKQTIKQSPDRTCCKAIKQMKRDVYQQHQKNKQTFEHPWKTDQS